LNKSLQRALACLPAVAFALVLALLLGSGDPARAMLQASPLQSPIEPLPTLSFPSPDIGRPPSDQFPTLAPPTSVPLPATVGPTPTALGFLPAPTIVNPNDLQSLPLARPPSYLGGQEPEPLPDPTPQPANTIVRAAVRLLNYLWLACGSLLLLGGAVAIIVLWRRGHKA
jgi:hypothetical protein